MKITFKEIIFSFIIILLFNNISFSQLNYIINNHHWSSSDLIEIYFEVENVGEETRRISYMSDIYLFDDNNYQYSFSDGYFSIDVYPHRKTNLSLHFFVRSDSKNLQLGFGSNNTTAFVSQGFEYDEEIAKVQKNEEQKIQIQKSLAKATLKYSEKNFDEVLNIYEYIGNVYYYMEDKNYPIGDLLDTVANTIERIINSLCDSKDFLKADSIVHNLENKLEYSDFEVYRYKLPRIIEQCKFNISQASEVEADSLLKAKKYSQAIENYKISVDILKFLNSKGKNTILYLKLANSFEKLGDNYFSVGKYRDALNCYDNSKSYIDDERIKKKIEKCYRKL